MKKALVIFVSATMMVASAFLTGCEDPATTTTSESKFVTSEDPTATFEQKVLLNGTEVAIYLTGGCKGVYLADENGHTYSDNTCGGYSLEGGELDEAKHMQKCDAIVLGTNSKITTSAAGFHTTS